MAQAWRWLCRRTSADEGDLRVLDLSYLLTLLMRACDLRGGDRYWPSHAAAEGVLDDNTFDYEDGLVCRSYHQSGRQPGKHPDDPGKNWHNNACSLARARLLALNVCLHLLPVMGVELLPGMHKPKFEYVDDEETFGKSVQANVASVHLVMGCPNTREDVEIVGKKEPLEQTRSSLKFDPITN